MARPASIPGANRNPEIIIEEPEPDSSETKEQQEQTSRRNSWIPYPNLESEETDDRYYTQDEFRLQCRIDCDEIYKVVNNVIAECKEMLAIKNEEVLILDQELAAAKNEIAQLKLRIK